MVNSATQSKQMARYSSRTFHRRLRTMALLGNALFDCITGNKA